MQQRVSLRLQRHLYWQALCLSRHTITGLLYTGAEQFADWTADYRLYSRDRVDVQQLFGVCRSEVESMLPMGAPLVVGMDDSILRKSGKKTPGVAWRVDPTGPPFQINFVLGQRVLQLSAAVPFGEGGTARSIPIDFVDAPTAKRPRKNATQQQKQEYRELQRQKNINAVAVERLTLLAVQTARDLWATVDGRFTNRTVMKQLPEKATLIGRIRSDAKLYGVPEGEQSRPVGGRPRRYGQRLPTPEEIRQDDAIPWQTVRCYAAGKIHEFRIKTMDAVKWRPAGAGKVLRMIVIAPLGYRLSQGGKMLYRQPAYLICTNPGLPLEEVLQAYLWRWGIEVNFRDEKSVMGVGQAQVRNEKSVQTVPAVAVAAYSLLLLAGIHAYGAEGIPQSLPDPKWLRGRKPRLCPTQRLISQLRWETWGDQIRDRGFCGFPTHPARSGTHQKPQKPPSPLASAALYARNV
ncbi:MAG: transposase [Prosthecobacter sp.]|uniref:transposase n=1 Tax=Prosthecobacter sp. TaxID=1965333 RepID=UPI003BAF84F4